MSSNKRIIQILVVLFIILAVIAIYLVKNPVSKELGMSKTASDSIDMEFDVTSLDMERYISYGLPIMVDFYGTTCGPCKMMEEDINSFYKNSLGKVTVRKLDAWEYPEGASDYPVVVVPTQMFITKEGEPYMPSEELMGKIQFSIYRWKDTGEVAYTVHQGILAYDEMVLIFKDMGVEL